MRVCKENITDICYKKWGFGPIKAEIRLGAFQGVTVFFQASPMYTRHIQVIKVVYLSLVNGSYYRWDLSQERERGNYVSSPTGVMEMMRGESGPR